MKDFIKNNNFFTKEGVPVDVKKLDLIEFDVDSFTVIANISTVYYYKSRDDFDKLKVEALTITNKNYGIRRLSNAEIDLIANADWIEIITEATLNQSKLEEKVNNNNDYLKDAILNRDKTIEQLLMEIRNLKEEISNLSKRIETVYKRSDDRIDKVWDSINKFNRHVHFTYSNQCQSTIPRY